GNEQSLGIEICSQSNANGATTDILIERVKIYNTGSDAIYGSYCSGEVMVRNCTVRSTRGYWGAIHPHQYHRMTVIGCLIAQCLASGGIRHGQIIMGNKIVSTG